MRGLAIALFALFCGAVPSGASPDKLALDPALAGAIPAPAPQAGATDPRVPFVFAEYYAIDPACASFALGDFDGDGHDDIALAEPGEGGIGFLINDGSDVFERGDALPLPAAPTAVVAADFNRDGVADLAAALAGGGVAVWTSAGAGSPVARDRRRSGRPLHSDPVLYDVPARLLAIGDLNGDARPDLVAVADGAVWGWLTRGHHFEAPRRYAYDGAADQVAIGDMNGDGFGDVVLHGNGDWLADLPPEWFLTVLHGARNGLEAPYRAELPRDTYTYYSWFSSMALADVDSDGDHDVFATGIGRDISIMFWNVAERSVGAPVARLEPGMMHPAIEAELGGCAIVAGDANADGSVDLVVLGAGFFGPIDAGIHVFTWRGGREVREAWSMAHGLQLYREGTRQVAVSAPQSGARPFFAALDNGRLAINRPLPAGGYIGFMEVALDEVLPVPPEPSRSKLSLVDFDGDGRSELLMSMLTCAVMFPIESDGTLGLGTVVAFEGYVRGVDLNGDGRTDLVSDGHVPLVVRLTSPDGIPGTPDLYGGRSLSALGDFDGDGTTDLLTKEPAGVRVLFNDGTGHFLPRSGPQRLDTFDLSPTGAMGVGDVDGDGRDDIALGLSAPLSRPVHVVGFLRGDGDGAFTRLRLFRLEQEEWETLPPMGIELADVDADGDVDAAVLRGCGDPRLIVDVLKNDGRGDFIESHTLAAHDEETRLYAHDVTGDGAVDLFVLALDWEGDGHFIEHLSDGAGGFTTVKLEAPFYGDGFAWGDVNGDGWIDAIYGGTHSDWSDGSIPGFAIAYNVLGATGAPLPAQGPRGRGPGPHPRASTEDDGAVTPGPSSAPLIQVHPNPSRGGFAVTWAPLATAPASLELLDIAGRRIAHRALPAGWRGTVRDLAGGRSLAAGLYWVRLTQETASTTVRFVVVD